MDIETIALETAIQDLYEAGQPIPKELQHLAGRLDFDPDDSHVAELPDETITPESANLESVIGALGDYVNFWSQCFNLVQLPQKRNERFLKLFVELTRTLIQIRATRSVRRNCKS